MKRLRLIALGFFVWGFLSYAAIAKEPLALIGTIVKWRYPEAEISKSVMSDGGHMNSEGNRTVPSTILKTTMVTADSVDQVMEFYKDLLSRTADNDARLGIDSEEGQSVIFNNESEGRSMALHTIIVNSARASTTIIISRGQNEDRTYITWKQFVKHQ